MTIKNIITAIILTGLGIWGITVMLKPLNIDPKSQMTGPVNSGVLEGQNIPEVIGFVNDHANLLNESTKSKLETTLKTFSESKKGELVILTVTTMNGLSIDEFGIRVGEKWKVGHAGIDNGIIMIISTGERKVKIEVGRGSEITDAQAGQILDTYMVPLLKQDKWAEAIIAGTEALITLINK